MTEIILHPSRDFLNARNPSSPFQYKQAMHNAIWDKIENESYIQNDIIGIRINDTYFFANTNEELFQEIKNNWGL